MELVHTCTKHGNMQAHTKDMHDKEELSPSDMNYGNSSQWTCQIWITKVRGLAKFRLGKSVDFPNLEYDSHALRVTCIIILIILQAEHYILHISYDVVHIILSYAMRP